MAVVHSFLSGICVFVLGIVHLYIACWGHNVTTAAMVAEHLRNSFYFGSLIALLIFAFIHSLCGLRYFNKIRYFVWKARNCKFYFNRNWRECFVFRDFKYFFASLGVMRGGNK